MGRYKILFIISLFFICHASEGQYRIQDIPDSLKKNADAVYFLNELRFEIKGAEKAIKKVRQVIAIMNAQAKHSAVFGIHYNELSKINEVEAKVYDQQGKLIKKLGKNDYKDQSNSDGLYGDNRVLIADLKQLHYPYIVEIVYEVQLDYTYFIPNFYAYPSWNSSIMASVYELTCPKEFQPNFKLINTDHKLMRSTQISTGLQVNSLRFSNLPAIKPEAYGEALHQFTPVLYATPSNFSFEGYEGDFNTWESMGKWQIVLNQGRDLISAETKQKMKVLTSNLTSKEEVIKAVYEFVQNKTRYVSIQLGIGGFQPFPASQVDETGYGDCKALSNYTAALLKSLDIESHYSWVYGGDNPPEVDPNFPNDSFNHIILCVPNEQDTLWLECTSQTNPFGYMGTFTGDRDVLLVTEHGSVLGHTPEYPKEVNQQNTLAEVKIFSDGNAYASIDIEYTGTQYENGDLNFYIHDGDEALKKWINRNTSIPKFNLNSFDFTLHADKIPSIEQEMAMEIPDFASVSGTRLFLSPNLMNRWESSPRRVSNRQTDVVLKSAYQDYDSISYSIPENYHLEYLPEGINIETDFGNYATDFKFINHQLVYTRRVSRDKGTFPKERYEEFRSFYNAVIKADKAKVVFVDKS